jgi:hypothetical protein
MTIDTTLFSKEGGQGDGFQEEQKGNKSAGLPRRKSGA